MSTKAAAPKVRSQSKGKTAAVKKHTYLEMIQVALLTLNERGGSSRQEIWKCVEAKFPEADFKRYLIALKRLSKDENVIEQGKNQHRFTLNRSFKDKAVRRLAKGMPLKSILFTNGMVDPLKKKMKKKPAKKAKKPKKKKAKKSSKKNAKGKKGAAKGKKAAKGSTTKDKIKEKAKQNKKTAGNKATKAKVDGKKAKGDKKVAAKTKANTNKAKKDQKKKPAAKSNR